MFQRAVRFPKQKSPMHIHCKISVNDVRSEITVKNTYIVHDMTIVIQNVMHRIPTVKPAPNHHGLVVTPLTAKVPQRCAPDPCAQRSALEKSAASQSESPGVGGDVFW